VMSRNGTRGVGAGNRFAYNQQRSKNRGVAQFG
jgi:hypothetical protein